MKFKFRSCCKWWNYCSLFIMSRLLDESKLFIILFKLAQLVKFELNLILILGKLDCVSSRGGGRGGGGERGWYRSGTVNSKSFVGRDFLWNKWKYELTMHFKHEMIGKHFTETSNKVELRINRFPINRARPVLLYSEWTQDCVRYSSFQQNALIGFA